MPRHRNDRDYPRDIYLVLIVLFLAAIGVGAMLGALFLLLTHR